MKPQRELLPAGPAAASSASSERESTPQSATGGSATGSAPRRRPQTKIACTSCRRRKSKCDGQRPVCSLCAGLGRTRCEYDAGPDVTRFAALKSKHEELQRRVSRFEELFRLLSTRSEAESIEIIRRMRTANIETDLEDLVKFIKNADLLIQLASAKSEQTSPGPGASDSTAQGQMLMDELAPLLKILKTAVSKLDAPARTAFLDTIRLQIDALTSVDGIQDPPATASSRATGNEDTDCAVDGSSNSRPGFFLEGLLNHDTSKPK